MARNILRIFPNYSKQYTPTDRYVYCPPIINKQKSVDVPLIATNTDVSEIHISCIFSWDRPWCEDFRYQLEGRVKVPIKIGGPAYGSSATDFVPGMYLKRNIIFTTRGCNNNCPWCNVPKLEGRLKELPILPGNWIQDNNFLQANRTHKEKVFDMLKKQRGICFKGGLEADLIDEHFISGIRDLKIAELWLACDTDARLPEFKKACERLKNAGFSRDKIKCYCLSYGKNRDKDNARAEAIYEAGAMPSVQLYRDFSDTKTKYSRDWEQWARSWQRPAAIKAHMEKGTDYKNYNT